MIKTNPICWNNQHIISKLCEHMAIELDQMFGVFFVLFFFYLSFCILKRES